MPQIMFRMCLLNVLGLFWFIGVVFGEDGWSVCISDDVSFSRHLLLGCCFLILMQPLIEASIPPDPKKAPNRVSGRCSLLPIPKEQV